MSRPLSRFRRVSNSRNVCKIGCGTNLNIFLERTLRFLEIYREIFQRSRLARRRIRQVDFPFSAEIVLAVSINEFKHVIVKAKSLDQRFYSIIYLNPL